MIRIFLVALILISDFSFALDNQQICHDLLQSSHARMALPIDPTGVQALLPELVNIRLIGDGNSLPMLFDEGPQNYLKAVVAIFKTQGNPHLHAEGDKLSESIRRQVNKLVMVNPDQMSHRLILEAKGVIDHELNKLPTKLLSISYKTGRTVFVTLGPITEAPAFSHLKGIIPRGWNLPWDSIPGAGGGRLGAAVNAECLTSGHESANLVLHEVLHNIDAARTDIAGSAFSDQTEFRRIWRETSYRDFDKYEETYPEEAFAEFGAWFYDSPKSRQMLRDLYPQWYAYFYRFDHEWSRPSL